MDGKPWRLMAEKVLPLPPVQVWELLSNTEHLIGPLACQVSFMRSQWSLMTTFTVMLLSRSLVSSRSAGRNTPFAGYGRSAIAYYGFLRVVS